MAKPMRLLGVGSRFSTLALAMLGGLTLGGLGACSSSEAGAKSEGMASEGMVSEGMALPESASIDDKSGEPEQVVRQMKASPEPRSAPGAVATARGVAGEAIPSEARASAAGVSRASGGLAPRSNSAETITSKHLEAELNRLEAELAN
jgi:hypothetical protein